MKKHRTKTLLILFGASLSLALIGLATAVFGGLKDIVWLMYLGVAATAVSLIISLYANRALDRAIKDNYARITSRVDEKMTEAKNMMDRIYRRKTGPLSDQKTQPDSSNEQ